MNPTTQDVVNRLRPIFEKAVHDRTGVSFLLTNAEAAVFTAADLSALEEETGYYPSYEFRKYDSSVLIATQSLSESHEISLENSLADKLVIVEKIISEKYSNKKQVDTSKMNC